MARPHLDRVLQHLRHWLGPRPGTGQADGELLEQFLRQRDAAAFETLVRRHGAMVLDVCRSLLGSEHDAEDAFQATFLVLARQAASIRRRESLGSWLHGVAHRTSLRARANAARRRFHERQALPMPQPDETPEADQAELRRLLHEELQHLPEKYRAPLVLCCLEGKTNEEAAAELGWPKGTVQTRIARGRDRLRQRLAARGVALSLAAVRAALTPAAPALPPALVTNTVQVAAALAAGTGSSSAAVLLAEEVAKMMRTSKWMTAASVILVLGLAGAGGFLLHHAPAAPEPAANPAPAAKAPAPAPAATDLYGDPLPPGAVGRLGTVRLRHGGADTAVVHSPDGRLLASWSRHPMFALRLWDAHTGKPLPLQCANMDGVDAAAFSPDGKLLAAVSADARLHPSEQKCEVILWQTETGQEVRRLTTGAKFWTNSVPSRLRSLAFSPDGKVLAGAGEHPTLWLWDPATGKELRRITPPAGNVGLVAFSADGQTLISAAQGDAVRWWAVATGKQLRQAVQGQLQWQYAGIGAGGKQVALAPDGKTLAWTKPGLPFIVRRWDLEADKELPPLRHPNSINTVAFSGDGKLIATSCSDRKIHFFDAATGQDLRQSREDVNFYTWCLSFSPDGKTIATAGNEPVIRLFETATGAERVVATGHLDNPTHVFFCTGGREAITASWDGTLRVWDPATGKQLRTFAGNARAFAVAPDGRTLGLWLHDNAIQLLDLETGKEIRRWKGHPGGVDGREGRSGLRHPDFTPHGMAFSPDGKYVSVGSYDGSVPVWEVATGKEHQILKTARGLVATVAFSSDGQTVAGGSVEAVVLWDRTTGNQLRELTGLKRVVRSLAFSPDSKTLAAAAEHTLHVWTVATGRPLHTFEEQGDVNSVVFSPDGRTLAACSGGALCLWETATGMERHRFIDPSGRCSGAAFSPDSKTMATISGDGTVLLWGR